MTTNRTTRTIYVLLAIAAASATAACASDAKLRWDTRTTPVVVAGSPTLVAIDTDVWVVRDADHAVYYADDAYWAIHDNHWYRSFTFDAGFVPVDDDTVPRSVVNRNHPYYAQYHGEATAQTRRPPLAHGNPHAQDAERKTSGVTPSSKHESGL